jgi:hypothetical protein
MGIGSDYAGPMFMSPFLERELEALSIDPAQERAVRSFAEKGYLIIEDLELGDFDEIADQVHGALGPLHEDGRFNRLAEAWTMCEPVHAIATAPKVLATLELLYGRRPIPFQTLNFWRGSQQPTHSDAVHFHCFPKHLMCGVWVAFEDTDGGNGALHYYPGSHLESDLEFADLGLPPGKESYAKYEQYVRSVIEVRGLQKETIFMKKGQALIWAANLLHGGDPVTEPDRTRVSQVTHYYFENCSYYTPFRTDLARGKVFFRRITDLTTGKLVPARVNGRRVPIPLTARFAVRQRAIRRTLGRGLERHPK